MLEGLVETGEDVVEPDAGFDFEPALPAAAAATGPRPASHPGGEGLAVVDDSTGGGDGGSFLDSLPVLLDSPDGKASFFGVRPDSGCSFGWIVVEADVGGAMVVVVVVKLSSGCFLSSSGVDSSFFGSSLPSLGLPVLMLSATIAGV